MCGTAAQWNPDNDQIVQICNNQMQKPWPVRSPAGFDIKNWLMCFNCSRCFFFIDTKMYCKNVSLLLWVCYLVRFCFKSKAQILRHILTLLEKIWIIQNKCGIKYKWMLPTNMPLHQQQYPAYTNRPPPPPPPPLPEYNSHPPHPIEHPLLSDRGKDGLRRHSRSILQREKERGKEAGRRGEGGREKVKEKGEKKKRGEVRRGGQKAEWLQSTLGSGSDRRGFWNIYLC